MNFTLTALPSFKDDKYDKLKSTKYITHMRMFCPHLLANTDFIGRPLTCIIKSGIVLGGKRRASVKTIAGKELRRKKRKKIRKSEVEREEE